jgi:hypothetical protein
MSPPITNNPVMAYDANRHRIVVFVTTTTATETWEWDGTSWTKAAPSASPDKRIQPAMVYEPRRQRVMLLGGSFASVSPWEWDGTTWTQTAAGASLQPLPSIANAAAYDLVHDDIVEFGGTAVTSVLSTTNLASFRGADEEVCGSGHDVDGDGRIGCADENCAAACSSCGNGACDGVENDRLCPADCPAPAPICGDAYCAPGEACPADCAL